MKTYRELMEGKPSKRIAGKMRTLIKKLMSGRQIMVDGPNKKGVFSFFTFGDSPKEPNKLVGTWDSKKETFKSDVKQVEKFINNNLDSITI